MTQPQRPSWNCIAPSGFSSDQISAMGGCFVLMACAILLSIGRLLDDPFVGLLFYIIEKIPAQSLREAGKMIVNRKGR